MVDKPVGVAAHPSPGWDGPTVIGGLAAAGHRVSTSGAEERQGVVHRLDVGTSGLMVVAKSERAYTVLKDAFRERTVDKRYHALVQGHPDPMTGTIDAPIDRHPTSAYKFAVVAGGRRQRHALRDDRGVPARDAARRPPRDRPDPPDPGAHGGAAAPVRRRPDLRRRPDAVRRSSASSGSGCTRCGSASRTPTTGGGWSSSSPYAADLQRALDTHRGDVVKLDDLDEQWVPRLASRLRAFVDNAGVRRARLAERIGNARRRRCSTRRRSRRFAASTTGTPAVVRSRCCATSRSSDCCSSPPCS